MGPDAAAFGAALAAALETVPVESPVPSRLAGLKGTVQLAFDERRVPTITCERLTDAALALGFVVAGDRLFQLDVLRRLAQGRLAELLGSDAIGLDVDHRGLGFEAVAAAAYERLPRDQRDLADAYADGVNAACSAGAQAVELVALGEAFAPWSPVDSLCVALVLSKLLGHEAEHRRTREVLGQALSAELAAFLTPDAAPDRYDIDGTASPGPQPVVPAAALAGIYANPVAPDLAAAPGPSASARGSNAWALAGGGPSGPRAVLANDMHLDLGVPDPWYRARLVVAGRTIDGLFAPGLPVAVAGSSPEVAWGATRLVADDADLVTVDPQLDEIVERVEVISVRGQDDVSLVVATSPFGPLRGQAFAGSRIALHSPLLDPAALDLGLAGLMDAADVDEACDVANRSGGPRLNIVLADATGRIGWTVAGRFPERAADDHGGMVVRSRGDEPWTRYLAPNRLPRVVDPESGMIVSANNATPSHACGGIAVNGFPADRAARAAELLRATGPQESELFAYQHDDRVEFYRFYVELIGKAIPEGSGDRLDAAARCVANWDGTAGIDAEGLPLLTAFHEFLRECVMRPIFGPCAVLDPAFEYAWNDYEAALRAIVSLRDPQAVPPPAPSWSVLIQTAALMALDSVQVVDADGASRPARWGEANPTGIHHLLGRHAGEVVLDRPFVGQPGTPRAIRVAEPGFGAAMRLVVSPGAPSDGLLTVPGGQAGHPRSPAYGDGFAAWLGAEPRPLAPGPCVTSHAIVAA